MRSRSTRPTRSTRASRSSESSARHGPRASTVRARGDPIEVAEPWVAGLDGIEKFERIEVLYWLHESRRDLVRQSPANDGETRGTFALRSPVRPNPIGTALVGLVERRGSTLLVRGLDCLDGTPLIDLKPDRCLFTPLAPPQAGDFETG